MGTFFPAYHSCGSSGQTMLPFGSEGGHDWANHCQQGGQGEKPELANSIAAKHSENISQLSRMTVYACLHAMTVQTAAR